MRQVGIVAAAGIISLETMTKRLGEDHARAKKMADGLKQVEGLVLDAGTPSTNMIYFDLADRIPFDERELCEKMLKFGVLMDWASARRIRLVTHVGVDDSAVEKTVNAFRAVFGSGA